MSLKEVRSESVVSVTVRPDAVDAGNPRMLLFVPGDVICFLGTLMHVKDLRPVGNPDAPEAYDLTLTTAL